MSLMKVEMAKIFFLYSELNILPCFYKDIVHIWLGGQSPWSPLLVYPAAFFYAYPVLISSSSFIFN